MTVASIAVATVAVPLLLGMSVGYGVRRVRGARLRGFASLVVAVTLPTVAVVAVLARYPLVGVWDAVFTGLLCGAGFVVAAHAALADPQRLAALGIGSVIGVLLLELAVSLALAPPPRFPSTAGVHLWLADSIRASRETQGWDMRSREIACAIIYGDRFRGLLDIGEETDIGAPARYAPRADAKRRELHVGDSMVFGLGVERDETFTAALAALEPATEHVNAGIPGLAPDAYLAVLERWIARQRFDAVTMYLFESNDVRDLDGPYPCCGFAPLLAYDGTTAHLRCPQPTPVDLGSAGFEWLRYNSPPPYLVRALVDSSAAAAYVGAALVEAGHRYSLSSASSPDEQMQHLATILRTARDELASSGTAFRVVIFPTRVDPTGQKSPQEMQIAALAQDLGIPLLDAGEPLRAALGDHRDLFVRPNDPHFNRDGHRLIAEWLHNAW